MTKPRESWLSSDDPKKFAAAMMCCKHPAAYCAEDGYCHYGGKCFEPKTKDILATINQRLCRIERLMKSLLESKEP